MGFLEVMYSLLVSGLLIVMIAVPAITVTDGSDASITPYIWLITDWLVIAYLYWSYQ